MKPRKTGDPKDPEKHAGSARFVPISGTFGTEVIVPAALTSGPPKPEPEERWTLAPGHRPGAGAGADDAAVEPVPVDPVRGKVSRPAAEDGKPDPA